MIDLRISDAARRKIASTISAEAGRNLLSAFVWTGGTNGKEGSWVFGFYTRNKIPPNEVEVVDGIEFVVAGPPLYVPLLNGKRLDISDDQFVILAR